MANNDFSKLFCFVKGVLISAEVIKASKMKLHHDVKMHFNQVLASSKLFEKHMHKILGAEYAEMEDDLNGCLVGIIWSIYEMKPEEREQFISHMEKFELKEDGKLETKND